MKRDMVCVACLQVIQATIAQAKRHGWTLWVGGALCKRCSDEAHAFAVAANVEGPK